MSPNHRFAISLIVVVILAALGFGSWHFLGRDDGPPVTVAQQPSSPAPATAETAAPAAEASAVSEAAPETVPETAPEPEPAPVELAFDLVRVEPTGDAVIAGRGAPGARVELLRNGETHDSLVVDATGAFAFVPPPLPAGTSDVTLRATLPSGEVLTSRQSVTIVVDESLTQQPMVAMVEPGAATVVLSRPETPAAAEPAEAPAAEVVEETGEESGEEVAERTAEAPAPAASETAQGETAQIETVAAAENAATETSAAEVETPAAEAAEAATAEPAPAEQSVAEAAPAPEQAAPAAAETTAQPARPAPPAAPARAAIRIESVEAETGGGLFVTGAGAPLAQIRLYLNDTFVARAQTDTAGAVSFAIGRGVMPGSYQVRLDEVADLTGQVLSRAEVSFAVPAFVAVAPEAETEATAETPAQAAAQPQTEVAAAAPETPASADPAATSRDPATVTIPEVSTAQVTRGDSLWRISRQIYGRGVRYTEIFEANKDQIRDPDLIYPGQIFVLPTDSGSAD